MIEWATGPRIVVPPMTPDTIVIEQMVTGILPSQEPVSRTICLVCDEIPGERLVTLITLVYAGHADIIDNTIYSGTFFIHVDEIPEDPATVFILAHDKHDFAPWVEV